MKLEGGGEDGWREKDKKGERDGGHDVGVGEKENINIYISKEVADKNLV